jgi:hypothetical protein
MLLSESALLLTFSLLNFLNRLNHFWNSSLSILGYQESKKLVSQQFRDWSVCTVVQAGLALYCLQKL